MVYNQLIIFKFIKHLKNKHSVYRCNYYLRRHLYFGRLQLLFLRIKKDFEQCY